VDLVQSMFNHEPKKPLLVGFLLMLIFKILNEVFSIVFELKYVFVQSVYPIVGDSCVCIIFIKCISNFFGKYMDYVLYEHTLFHDCKRC
jgi:hypothetical protein